MSYPTQKTAPPTGSEQSNDHAKKAADELEQLKAAHPGISDDEIRRLQAAAKEVDQTSTGALKFGTGP